MWVYGILCLQRVRNRSYRTSTYQTQHLAQLVEQLADNRCVVGSNPIMLSETNVFDFKSESR